MHEVIRVEKMGYGPEAIGHLSNGKTVFVEGAAPQDVVDVEITSEKASYARAFVRKIIEGSPVRVQVKGDNASPEASWAHLAYDAQLEAKAACVRDALVRVAHMDAERVSALVGDVIACKNEWGYRNKIELAAFRDEGGRFCLGYHKHASKAIAATARAPLANRLIEGAPKSLTGALRYLQGTSDLGIYRVGVRGSVRTKSIEVALWTPPSSFPRSFAAKTLKDAIGATSVVRVIANPGSARKVKRVEVLDGSGFWTERMEAVSGCDFLFSVSAPSFFQVNTAQAEKLVSIVLDELKPTSDMRIADLYCGVGTFTLPLSATGAEVIGIELAGSSVRDLRRNCDDAGEDIDVICDDTALALPSVGEIDAVVVDPPRAGLERRVIEQLADAHPQKIAYVSCDPQTFARDAALLEERGYALLKATPVDMFPQTYHIETVGAFGRKSS